MRSSEVITHWGLHWGKLGVETIENGKPCNVLVETMKMMRLVRQSFDGDDIDKSTILTPVVRVLVSCDRMTWTNIPLVCLQYRNDSATGHDHRLISTQHSETPWLCRASTFWDKCVPVPPCMCSCLSCCSAVCRVLPQSDSQLTEMVQECDWTCTEWESGVRQFSALCVLLYTTHYTTHYTTLHYTTLHTTLPPFTSFTCLADRQWMFCPNQVPFRAHFFCCWQCYLAGRCCTVW